MPETTATTPTEPAPHPTTRTRATTSKKTRKAKAKAKNTWTDATKAKYRAAIKAGRQTYASIAKDLGIRPQTVWAQLNRA